MHNGVSKESNSTASCPLQPILLLLFFGSGCAALIYEIVWFQMLQLVIGSSAVSMGVLLGTFMGGMCLGSLLLPRMISAARHPLRIYMLLELGIGIFGILILFGMPAAAWVYAAHVGSGLGGIRLRGLFAAVCLLPPTILMGATLPAIARWVKATPGGISWLGFFYGSNIAGAVFGCLLAGFYLLRIYDSVVATFVAAAINGAVALAAFVFSFAARHEISAETQPPPDAAEENFPVSKKTPWLVYVTIALSGMSALGAEVVWTRLLSLTLGGTVYTFSIILAVFLFGLGVGSGIGATLARSSRQPWALLGCCQLLLTGAIAWTAYMLAQSLPYWPIDPSLTRSVWLNFQLDLVRCLWALLPGAVLWGASFPLALAAVRIQEPARLVGGIYAANTVGGILGGIGFSIVFIPLIGTQQSQRLLVGLAAAAALLVFAAFIGKFRKSFASAFGGAVILAALVLVPLALARGIAKVPGELIAYGRYAATEFGQIDILYVGEGMNNSVAVSQGWDDDFRNFHISGKIEASSDPQDMRLQRMLSDIPALIHPHLRSVLVVGCGAGVTAGAFTVLPDIKQITICELEPLVPKIAAEYFGEENYNVVNDPRTRIIYDDARHYILTTREKFDVITSDPIHPWVKGSATLYTKEYFELVKAHLNPGGIVTQWVPLYESDTDAVKSEIATFFEVFPDGTIWSNDQNGKGYDLVLLGQAGPTKINLDEIAARLAQPQYSALAGSLREVGFDSAFDVFATYAGQACDLAPWLKNAQINRDRNLRLQYLAGLSSNWYHNESIYEDMIAYRKFPNTLFAGSDDSIENLKITMAKAWLKK
ncbi:MAG TPA: fused MFS/spermidine synthase [Candidatus Aquilonibacter sp.]|nr:fused MFS/spermidine synthase [Candidatus Aquilonibacter sp.]